MSNKRTKLTLEQVKAAGYCIVSRRHRIAGRLDCKEWKARLAATHVDGDRWVKALGDRHAADQYRRCTSKDWITVPEFWIKQLQNSIDGPQDFKPLPA